MIKNKIFIIAEAGVNHNGSLEIAKKLVEAAAAAGADAVKFQTFKADALVAAHAPKAQYQLTTTDREESQLEMLSKLELSRESHLELVSYCGEKNIQFLSTPFDLGSADFLINTLNLPCIKISSGEVTTAPLLLSIAKSNKPVILSTGMCTIDEIEQALGVLAFGYLNSQLRPSAGEFEKAYASLEGQRLLKDKVILLHCTSEYPAPLTNIHLRAMDTMRELFELPVGYSDHSLGINVSLAAVARGAVLIEKHFTLDKSLPGPDHQASLDPQELILLVKGIREVEQALGNADKKPNVNELKVRAVARKSLIALKEIQVGEVFSEKNLGVKRPGTGISPMLYWDFLGKPAVNSYTTGDLIHE